MKKMFLFTFLFVLAAGLASTQFYTDEYGQQGLRLMMRVDTYTDGSRSVQHFVLDPETGEPLPLQVAAADMYFSVEGAVQLQKAVLTRSLHWDWPILIKFDNTPDAKSKKKFVRKILNKFNNRRRGNNNTPRMKVLNKVIQVKPLSSFSNPAQFYIQFNWDEHNTVILTKDDQFFENPLGVLKDPEILTSTIIFTFATLTLEGNRFIGTYYIVEADVYLRSDFFMRSKIQYYRLGTAAFRMTLGYQPTTWSHDYLSNKGHHVSNNAFSNKASSIWTDISHVRDDFFYLDKLGINYTPVYLSTPLLLPFENEVIDLGDYDLPKIDEQGNVDMSKTTILFLTNLLGLDKRNTRMKIWIYRVTDDNPPKNIRIVTLRGNTMRYPVPVQGYTQKFYPSIFLNQVRLGRERDLNKLKKAINKYGMQRVIDGVDFEKALQIKVKIKGFLGEDGKMESLSRLFWLVNTEEL